MKTCAKLVQEELCLVREETLEDLVVVVRGRRGRGRRPGRRHHALVRLRRARRRGRRDGEVRVDKQSPSHTQIPKSATQILTDSPLTIRHTFEAGVVCFSFDPRKRHRKTLAEVHAPVPGYERKMRDAVARVFTKLENRQTAVARKLGFAKFRRSRVNRPRVAPNQRGDRRRR